jgi:putative ABC transport system permease protein
VRSGLTRQALRRHPWGFIGPAGTQALGAAVVSGALGALHSLDAAPLDPAARATLDATDVPAIAAVFVMIAVYLTAILVGVTMGAAIARQARDIALARAIGATPGQVRRAVAAQAALVALPATLIGVPLGTLGGRLWIDGLAAHHVISGAVGYRSSPAALPVALAITVGTSLVGALIAAIRPARVRPATALAETAAPRRGTGAVRTALGVVLLSAGTLTSLGISHADPAQADGLGFLVMLALCLGAGLLAPALLRATAPALRLGGDLGALAADDLAVRARALSGALVPLVLAVAFATVKVAAHTTSEHLTGVPDRAADRWTDYSGTAVYTAFALVAALNTLITVALARRRDLAAMRLAGGTRARVLAVLIGEALLVAAVAIGLAAGVSAVTLVPLLHPALGVWVPWLPAGYLAAAGLGVAALVLAGSVVPAAVLMRRPAIADLEGGT